MEYPGDDRGRTEAALKASEERFRDFAEVSSDWFWEQDEDLRFTYVSARNSANTGVLPEDLYGKTRRESGIQGVTEADLCAHEMLLQQRRPFEDFRFLRVRGDGRIFYISVSGKPVFGKDGAFLGYRGTGRDITQLVEAEEKLREQLEIAESANRAKSRFLAQMTHELRTPMNAIFGFAELLQMEVHGPLTPQQKSDVAHILAGGKHLLELINKVLDIAKMEYEDVLVNLEEVNANHVVAECLALVAAIAKQRRVGIVDRFSDTSPSLMMTDRLRLKQILLNLLSNAVKYNSEGGSVTVSGQTTADDFLRLSVTDTGVGIPEAECPHVFQMFHRLGLEPTIAKEGTGIGLAATKRMVERLAGRIGFQSEVGVGSTFWFELPLACNRDPLIWTDMLRIGVPAIDSDHETMISLVNQLVSTSADAADVDVVIDRLITYTQNHFRREEAVMEVCGYPGLEKHRSFHRILTARVGELAERWRADRSSEMLVELREFLWIWLFDHIIMIDSSLAGYAKGKDRAIRTALAAVATDVD